MRMNRKERETRAKRLCRLDRIELMIGKAIMNLIGGLVATGILLGIIALLGMFMNWIETSIIRFIIFLVVGGITIAKMTYEEIKLQ